MKGGRKYLAYRTPRGFLRLKLFPLPHMPLDLKSLYPPPHHTGTPDHAAVRRNANVSFHHHRVYGGFVFVFINRLTMMLLYIESKTP